MTEISAPILIFATEAERARELLIHAVILSTALLMHAQECLADAHLQH
jgi:hypothetical protein